MRCKGDFKDDRICDMCQISNTFEYKICSESYFKIKESEMFIKHMKQNCPHSKYHNDGYYDWYYECKIKRGGFEGCNPAEECKKHLKKSN